MKFGKYLMNSLNVLNLFLLVATAVIFFCFIDPLMSAPRSVSIPAPGKISPDTSPAVDNETSEPQTPDYTVIGEMNLFHPDRIIPPEKTEKKDAMLMPRPELVFYGTMIANGLKIAFVQDKKAAPSTPGRGARQITLREGETIGGYTVRKITEKTIVIANGEDQMTLNLDELKERTVETTATGKAPTPAAAHAIQPAHRTSRAPSSPAMPPGALMAPIPQFPPSMQGAQPETLPPPSTPAAVIPMPSSFHIKRPSR